MFLAAECERRQVKGLKLRFKSTIIGAVNAPERGKVGTLFQIYHDNPPKAGRERGKSETVFQICHDDPHKPGQEGGKYGPGSDVCSQ